jgi:biopolymer transport protein ExbD
MAAVQNGNGEDEGPLASINIIPFVDIVLVLLIIFMLTSIAIVRASMVVNLPKAATGGARVESTVNIICNKDGTLMLNGAASSVDEIGNFVKRESKANPKLQAVIAADKGVEYGHVVDLIDLVKRNGVSAFALDVERNTGAP